MNNNFPKEYLLYAAQYGNKIESVGWCLHDAITYSSTTHAREMVFFDAVRADPWNGNIRNAGALNAPYGMLLRNVRLKPKFARLRSVTAVAGTGNQTGTLDDVIQLLYRTAFEITIGDKTYYSCPLWMVLSAGGEFGGNAAVGTLAAAVTIQHATIGVPSSRASLTFPKPIFLPPQMPFRPRIIFSGAITFDQNPDIHLAFEGDLVRPVQ
jgi:hypothetical protein